MKLNVLCTVYTRRLYDAVLCIVRRHRITFDAEENGDDEVLVDSCRSSCPLRLHVS